MMQTNQQMSFWSSHGFWTHQDWYFILNHYTTKIPNIDCGITQENGVFSFSCLFVALKIEQDFRLMFGEVISNKFLERWPTTFKRKVMEESHGLVPTTELLDLMRNAESVVEVENGMCTFFNIVTAVLCRCIICILVILQILN